VFFLEGGCEFCLLKVIHGAELGFFTVVNGTETGLFSGELWLSGAHSEGQMDHIEW
jgi:hypothetical protein